MRIFDEVDDDKSDKDMALSLSYVIEWCDAKSWAAFFHNVSNNVAPGLAHVPVTVTPATVKQVSQIVADVSSLSKLIDDHLALQAITRAYQVQKHSYTHPF